VFPLGVLLLNLSLESWSKIDEYSSSFPDGFEFKGSHGEHFMQIGNAVPPLLARALAQQVIGQLKLFCRFN